MNAERVVNVQDQLRVASPSPTVHDDGARDVVFGGPGLDLYFADLGVGRPDLLRGVGRAEQAWDID